MGDVRKAKYPVFLIDTDNYMDMLSEEDDISHLEAIDVEAEEYHGWDAEGCPLGVGIGVNDEIWIGLKSTAGSPGLVRDAILHYAKLAGRGRMFQPSHQDLSLPRLFDEVESFIDEGRLSRRIRRFFSGGR